MRTQSKTEFSEHLELYIYGEPSSSGIPNWDTKHLPTGHSCKLSLFSY